MARHLCWKSLADVEKREISWFAAVWLFMPGFRIDIGEDHKVEAGHYLE